MSPLRRTIKKIISGRDAVDGAGVSLVRIFAHNDTNDFDPFLLLDAFDSRDPKDYIKGFPWHPHRGIETITYLIEGELEHGDSLGNGGTIFDGDCQWMTAGSGIIHQEMPQPAARLLGCQLWLNLPARDKMVDPQYNDILSKDILAVDEGAVNVRVIAGDYKGQKGAFEGKYVSLLYLDVKMKKDAEWVLETNSDSTCFIYLVQGSGRFDTSNNDRVTEKNAILFDHGDQFWAKAGESGVRFLLFSARPLGEPIAWGGPIVMNTQEELSQAFSDLRQNTFIRS